MREIKFRYTYKRKEDGKIYQGIIPIECLEGRGDRPLALDIHNPYWDIIARDLFTGLKDKNGKEIYEGDIILLVAHTILIKAVIEYQPGAFWFRGLDYNLTDCNWHHYDAEDREVIGNIYENPELVSG